MESELEAELDSVLQAELDSLSVKFDTVESPDVKINGIVDDVVNDYVNDNGDSVEDAVDMNAIDLNILTELNGEETNVFDLELISNLVKKLLAQQEELEYANLN